MTASATGQDGGIRSGSLLSLAPRQPGDGGIASASRPDKSRSAADVGSAVRRTVAPTPSPMLAALARSRDPVAGAAPEPANGAKSGKAEAEVETGPRTDRAFADEAVAENAAQDPPQSAASEARQPIETSPEATAPRPARPVEDPAGTMEASFSGACGFDSGPGRTPIAGNDGPESAKGLVARLRRQFVEGIPEGAVVSKDGESEKPVPEPARSRLDEVRYRLREFRAELLARAAGRK